MNVTALNCRTICIIVKNYKKTFCTYVITPFGHAKCCQQVYISQPNNKLVFGAESFVFQVAILKLKDQDI
jgi:hypothetical protein